MRAFLAVPADPAWVTSASALVGRLRGKLPAASWTRPESWHLTLKFLGEIPEEAAGRFAAAIAGALSRTGQGVLLAEGAILLPGSARPRVLGVGFAPRSSAFEPLASLVRAAEESGRSLGVPASHRAFRPHVTLARVRDRWSPQAVESFRTQTAAWDFPDWPVRSCVLYRSRLHPSGAIHTPVQEWTLPSAVSVQA